jgi:hypothetical protein
MNTTNFIIGALAIAVIAYFLWPYVRRYEGFAAQDKKVNGANGTKLKGINPTMGGTKNAENAVVPKKAPAALPTGKTEGFADYASTDAMGPVPMTGAQKPQGCYPREQLNPAQLLPNDPNSQWAQVNPTGAGDIQGKNFLSAGALIGVNTIGQSLRNSNLQLRAEPPNPQVQVSPWMISTVEPDLNRRPLE